MGTRKRIVRGQINLVQEERFRIVTGSGKAYLLVLAHSSPVAADDLREWYRSGTQVCAEYEGEPNVEDGVAHRVWRARVVAKSSSARVPGM